MLYPFELFHISIGRCFMKQCLAIKCLAFILKSVLSCQLDFVSTFLQMFFQLQFESLNLVSVCSDSIFDIIT